MQNTMVRGGGKWSAGEKNLELGKKNEKGLKNASFWAINSKIPPAVGQGCAPPAANLFIGGKN